MNLLKIFLILILTGGSVALGDNCATWVRRFVGTPGKRVSPAMAYDSDRGVTVFFGGEYSDAGSSTTTYYNDTWEYDGVSWRIIDTGANTASLRSPTPTRELTWALMTW